LIAKALGKKMIVTLLKVAGIKLWTTTSWSKLRSIFLLGIF